MSINIGNEAIAAAAALRDSPHWIAIRTALHSHVVGKMNAALDANGDAATRHDATGYARGLRDLWVAFEAATTGKAHNQTPKPGPGKSNV